MVLTRVAEEPRFAHANAQEVILAEVVVELHLARANRHIRFRHVSLCAQAAEQYNHFMLITQFPMSHILKQMPFFSCNDFANSWGK